MYRIKKINWKNGSGEILGFCAIIPMLFAMFLVLTAAIQVGITKQKMEYSAYSAGRAAAVSYSYSVAQTQASGVAAECMESVGFIDSSTVYTTIEVIDNPNTWEKGHFLKCTVRADLQTVLPSMFNQGLNGTKETSIVMMIENPSTN
ncbi:MAG: hypothetical protein IJ192_12475 [Clostridia bacterium]|nr:hypothetical protein [Clostridia bacterium]